MGMVEERVGAPARLHEVLEEVVLVARAAGRELLLEHEALALVGALGLAVPPHAVVRDAAEVGGLDLTELGGPRLVVKGLAEGLGVDPAGVTSPTFAIAAEYRFGADEPSGASSRCMFPVW